MQVHSAHRLFGGSYGPRRKKYNIGKNTCKDCKSFTDGMCFGNKRGGCRFFNTLTDFCFSSNE